MDVRNSYVERGHCGHFYTVSKDSELGFLHYSRETVPMEPMHLEVHRVDTTGDAAIALASAHAASAVIYVLVVFELPEIVDSQQLTRIARDEVLRYLDIA